MKESQKIRHAITGPKFSLIEKFSFYALWFATLYGIFLLISHFPLFPERYRLGAAIVSLTCVLFEFMKLHGEEIAKIAYACDQLEKIEEARNSWRYWFNFFGIFYSESDRELYFKLVQTNFLWSKLTPPRVIASTLVEPFGAVMSRLGIEAGESIAGFMKSLPEYRLLILTSLFAIFLANLYVLIHGPSASKAC